jgi:hypothetical protein
MKRRMLKVATTKEEAAEAVTQDLHPEVYLRIENVEGLRLPFFIVMCDDTAGVTHGKNGVAELPAIPEHARGVEPCDILDTILRSAAFCNAGQVERKSILREACRLIRACPDT